MIKYYLTIDIRNMITIPVAVIPSDHTENTFYHLQLDIRGTTHQSSVTTKPGFVKKFKVVPKFKGNVYWEVVSENSQETFVIFIDICVTG